MSNDVLTINDNDFRLSAESMPQTIVRLIHLNAGFVEQMANTNGG